MIPVSRVVQGAVPTESVLKHRRPADDPRVCRNRTARIDAGKKACCHWWRAVLPPIGGTTFSLNTCLIIRRFPSTRESAANDTSTRDTSSSPPVYEELYDLIEDPLEASQSHQRSVADRRSCKTCVDERMLLLPSTVVPTPPPLTLLRCSGRKVVLAGAQF